MKNIIQTKRFHLRRLTAADAPDMFILDSNPEVHRYLGNKPVKDISQSEAIIEDVLDQYERNNGLGRLAIIEKSSGTFVGWSGLKYETAPYNGRSGYYDIGYRLRPEFWGQGIATETALASIQYGFDTLQLDEICGAADIANIASNKVLQKIGLRQDGQFDWEGTTCNWYCLTRPEWEAKK